MAKIATNLEKHQKKSKNDNSLDNQDLDSKSQSFVDRNKYTFFDMKYKLTENELSIIKRKFLGSWGTWCQDGSNGWPAPVGVSGHEQAHRWPDEQPQPGERHEHVEANHPGHQPPVHFWVSSFHWSYSWNRNSPGNRLGKFLNHHRFSLDLIFSGR